MNAENFARWLRQKGHKVIKTQSSYWFDAGPRVYQAFPYHWLINPSKNELHELFLKHGVFALRYSTDVDSPIGCVSYHAVYDEPTYDIEMLDRRTRQNVRKGLKNCQVECITFEQLANDGWLLERDTFERQSREGQYTEQAWREMCKAAEKISGFQAWGALVDGQLAASLLTFRSGDCCEMIHQQCHRDFLNLRVNNALTFTVTQRMINKEAIQSVFYALQSLDASPSIDEFKFRMSFRAKAVRQRVEFHPIVKPLVNKFSHRLLVRIYNQRPENRQLAKTEGMLRFYLQGKLPLDKQIWPEAIEK